MHPHPSSAQRGRQWPRWLGWSMLCLLPLVGLLGSFESDDSLSQIQLAGHGGVGAHPQAASGAGEVALGAVNGPSKHSVSISGSVAGLYPGATLPLVLTVTNTEARVITVTSIGTVVSQASKHCLAANVHVTKFSGDLAVPAAGKAAITVEVKMAHSAKNACQGAVFPFRYHGLASTS